MPPACDIRPGTGKIRVIYRVQPVIQLDSTSIERWKLAAGALSHYSIITRTLPLEFPRNIVTRGAASWPSEFSFGQSAYRRVLPIVPSALFATLHGCSHGLAWHSTFPTAVERWLWRASSLSIATFRATFSAYLMVVNWTPWSTVSIKEKLEAFILLFYLSCFAYGLARLFLVVEAFVSMRALPAKAYEMPK